MKITKSKKIRGLDMDNLVKSVKEHLRIGGGFYFATVFWALVFRQLANVRHNLVMGGTDFWGWLLFTYFALLSGWTLGDNFNKSKDKIQP